MYSAHNVKMPMIVGILTLISRINTTDKRFKQRYSSDDKSGHLSQKESINSQILNKKTTNQSVWKMRLIMVVCMILYHGRMQRGNRGQDPSSGKSQVTAIGFLRLIY